MVFVVPGGGTSIQVSPDGLTFADVDREDAVAPAAPAGAWPMATARAEGAGFPGVAPADAVASQSWICWSVSGSPPASVHSRSSVGGHDFG